MHVVQCQAWAEAGQGLTAQRHHGPLGHNSSHNPKMHIRMRLTRQSGSTCELLLRSICVMRSLSMTVQMVNVCPQGCVCVLQVTDMKGSGRMAKSMVQALQWQQMGLLSMALGRMANVMGKG